jgi:YD repeat-containing protein
MRIGKTREYGRCTGRSKTVFFDSQGIGNTLTFTAGAITSGSGVAVTIDRDPEGRIVAIVDPNGNRVRYSYDANGDLASFTDRDGNVTQFV